MSRSDFEIVVVVEGSDAATSSTIQVAALLIGTACISACISAISLVDTSDRYLSSSPPRPPLLPLLVPRLLLLSLPLLLVSSSPPFPTVLLPLFFFSHVGVGVGVGVGTELRGLHRHGILTKEKRSHGTRGSSTVCPNPVTEFAVWISTSFIRWKVVHRVCWMVQRVHKGV